MKGIAILTVVAFLGQAPQSKFYEHTPSNIKFNLAGTSKLVKKKGDWTITFPVGASQATLRIYAISFTADPEVWEGTQKYFAEQQKMILMGVSREEILGVPLLLAKMQETATLDRTITLSGIVYAATDWKFSFRLSAPEAIYADAEVKWREALQSFATIDGRLPEPEKPGRATEASAGKKKAPEVPDFTRTKIGGGPNENPPVIGDIRLACSAAGKKLELCAPKGFSLTEKEGAIFVANEDLPAGALITIASSLDSSNMSNALLALSIKDLDNFTLVKKREESLPSENVAKSKVIRITREGDSAKGSLFSFLAGGEKGSYYWLLTWSAPGKPTAKQLAALESLVKGMSVEIAP